MRDTEGAGQTKELVETVREVTNLGVLGAAVNAGCGQR
jgi:hypothetical protein